MQRPSHLPRIWRSETGSLRRWPRARFESNHGTAGQFDQFWIDISGGHRHSPGGYTGPVLIHLARRSHTAQSRLFDVEGICALSVYLNTPLNLVIYPLKNVDTIVTVHQCVKVVTSSNLGTGPIPSSVPDPFPSMA